MSKSKFVYVVYIATTPESVWKAIVQGDITRQYWARENVSDWQVGSPWQHRRVDGSNTVDLVGKVLEVVPPKRLVMTWAAPAEASAPDKHTRVAFDIEPVDDMVRLTVTHDELVPGSDMERGISAGWPRVLSSMKTLLETGRPLNTWANKGA